MLKAMLHDRDGGVRCEAALALSRLDDASIADTMIGLLTANDHGVRGYAADWLGKHRIKKAVPYLIAAYEQSSRDAQSRLAWGLAQMADDSLVGFFPKALKSDHSNVRSAAVKAFSRMTPEIALPHFRNACADIEKFVWYPAVKAIYAVEGPASYDWFLSCTTSPTPSLRAASLFGVLHHRDRPFPKELIWKMLHDDEPSARLEAMGILGEGNIIGDARIPVLQSYLQETDICSALNRITGRQFTEPGAISSERDAIGESCAEMVRNRREPLEDFVERGVRRLDFKRIAAPAP